MVSCVLVVRINTSYSLNVLSQLSNNRDVVQPWVLLQLFLLILAVERSEVWDVMSAHTYSHLFSVIQPYLLGRDPHQHINNLIVAFSDSCKPCGMNRIYPPFTVSVIIQRLDCQVLTDERQGAGISGNRSNNNKADVHFGFGPLGDKVVVSLSECFYLMWRCSRQMWRHERESRWEAHSLFYIWVSVRGIQSRCVSHGMQWYKEERSRWFQVNLQ